MAGPFVHHLHVVLPGDRVSSPCVSQLGELRLVVGVGDRPGPQAVAERERDVVGAHDLADLAEVRVEEVLLVVGQAPLGDDRAAARHDAGHPPRGERDVAQQHAGVDGEVVHALLGLLDERVAVDLPGQLLGPPADLLQRLVDRHRADRHRRVAQDPLARLVDVVAGGEVHHRVGAPERRPAQLLDLLLDRRRDGRVADVGVDLHLEVPADDHRLELGVVDVGRDDRAAARHLARARTRRRIPSRRATNSISGGDLAPAGVVQLGDGAAAAATPRARRERRRHSRAEAGRRKLRGTPRRRARGSRRRGAAAAPRRTS